jgi:hypothetical protein
MNDHGGRSGDASPCHARAGNGAGHEGDPCDRERRRQRARGDARLEPPGQVGHVAKETTYGLPCWRLMSMVHGQRRLQTACLAAPFRAVRRSPEPRRRLASQELDPELLVVTSQS